MPRGRSGLRLRLRTMMALVALVAVGIGVGAWYRREQQRRPLRTLQRQQAATRLKAARTMLEQERNGLIDLMTPPERYYQASLKLLEAERDQDGSEADGRAALIGHRDRMRRLYEGMKAQTKGRTTEDDPADQSDPQRYAIVYLVDAEYYVAEAEFWVAQAEASR